MNVVNSPLAKMTSVASSFSGPMMNQENVIALIHYIVASGVIGGINIHDADADLGR